MPRSPAIHFLVALVLALSATPGSGQSPIGMDPGRAVRSRADLQRVLAEYEQALASPAYSETVKRTVRADAELIRDRLQNGDFRVGDRIALEVQGEENIPDTVAVEGGPIITLPLFGEIAIAGVLRSEIQAHLTTALSAFIRDPIVRATPLIRISVQGQIARPGFYTMPAQMLLGEALMAAGGPTPASDMDGIHVDRGTVRLLEGDPLQEAIRNGLTLDQLNFQAGDQIVVPDRPVGGSWLTTFGLITGVVGSVATLILLFAR